MARILVIGGSRFVGLRLVWTLLAQGHEVTTLNRGSHQDPFGSRIRRLHADRSSPDFLKVLATASFDAAVDFQAYSGDHARGVLAALRDRVGHYVLISSGQVYLVREGAARPPAAPLREDDYPGGLMDAPTDRRDHTEWAYGVGKRDAEDALWQAFQEHGFPYTALRLPMVDGEHDPSGRLEGYLWRILDDRPVLLPDGGSAPVRHVYSGDVARAVARLVGDPQTFGQAYNLCQDEMPTLRQLVDLLADLMGAPRRSMAIDGDTLHAAGIRPEQVSPFSTPWMSLLDPRKAKRDLGFHHQPLEAYLGHIVASFCSRPFALPPESYALRTRELELLGA